MPKIICLGVPCMISYFFKNSCHREEKEHGLEGFSGYIWSGIFRGIS